MKEKRTAKLTQGVVNGLQPEAQQYKVWDTELKGLNVLVMPSGTRTYFFSYRLGGRGGKQCCRKVGRRGSVTANEARAAAKIIAAQATRGSDVTAERHAAAEKVRQDAEKARQERASNLGVYLETRYLPWAAVHHKGSKETARVLNKEFAHLHGNPCGSITHWDMDTYRQQRLKAGVAQESVKRSIETLRGALSRAVKWKLLPHNPLAGYSHPKADKQGRRVRFLAPTEEKRLREALDDRQDKQRKERQRFNEWRRQRGQEPLPVLTDRFTDYLQPLVLLALNTGMRRGELFNLCWVDVNRKGRLLTVQGSGAKSGQTRHIPLNEEAYAALTAWADQADTQVLVFPSPRTGLRMDNINKSWGNLLEAASLQNFRFHDCRHHFASKLVMAGCDLNTVRELLGHASMDMTLRYAHLAPEHKAAAVALLDRPGAGLV